MRMSTIRTITSSIHGLNLHPRHPSYPSVHNSCRSIEISKLKHRYFFTETQRAQPGSIRRRIGSELHAIIKDNLSSGAPQPPPNLPTWAGWVLGSIFTVIIPLLTLKGGFLQKIGSKVEQVVDVVEDIVEAVEDVAEVVEDVAEAVEKVSSDVADNLPQGGILKDAALWIENASKEVREDAQETLDFIDKVEDLKEELEKDVDEFVDSLEEDEGEAKQKEVKVEERKEKVETVVDQPLTEQVEVVEKAAPVKPEAEGRRS
ncbi:uncharacterized protein LOC131234623 [Magnolia sinica]|uniref:uncharacterized protein LOC131234623 n=1 Tax=Magnolia sinica TaxID=86752 RepID=UPI0026597963|nr:uncharacterized protein LOC131234623 [Magnolia sinica]